MSLKYAVVLIASFAAGAFPASAATYVGSPLTAYTAQAHLDVVSALRAEGYEVTSVTRTFLGRIKIKAVRNGQSREVVVSRHTGEIKSDRQLSLVGTSQADEAPSGNGGADDIASAGNESGNASGGGGGVGNSGGNGGGGGSGGSGNGRGNN